MERIGLGFKILKENLWLWAIPLGIDFLGLALAILTNTLQLVPPGFHLKISVPNSLPSVANILKTSQTNGIELGGGSALFIVFIVLGPFLAGGFLNTIFKILKNNTADKASFLADCKYYFLRLLGVSILTFLFFLAVTLPAMLIFPLLGIVAILFIMYLTYFWQMSLVYHDLEIMEAFSKGREFFKNNFSQILSLFIPIAIFAGIISIPLNTMAQDVLGYALAILIWSFVGSIFAIAVISLYNDFENNQEFIDL